MCCALSILLMVLTLTEAAPIARGQSLSKRGFSINNMPVPMNRYIGPWPMYPNHPHPYGSKRLLRYCYEDQDSHDRMLPVIRATIRLWMPGMLISGLAIVSDPVFCRVDQDCLCKVGTPADTLVLSCGEEDSSTLGYRFLSEEPGRHKLVLKCDNQQSSTSSMHPRVRAAHELDGSRLVPKATLVLR